MWFEINVKVALMIAIDSPCYSRPLSLHTQVARYTGAHQLMTLGTSSKVIKLQHPTASPCCCVSFLTHYGDCVAPRPNFPTIISIDSLMP